MYRWCGSGFDERFDMDDGDRIRCLSGVRCWSSCSSPLTLYVGNGMLVVCCCCICRGDWDDGSLDPAELGAECASEADMLPCIQLVISFLEHQTGPRYRCLFLVVFPIQPRVS